jgi:hypothetical protein
MKKLKLRALLFTAIWLSSGQFAFAQKKNYQISVVAFYNFENLFDTENDPNKDDDEFTPDGPYHYTDIVYKEKLHNLATVLQQLGTEKTPDGPAIIGTAEIENGRVLTDLANQPEIKDRNYQHVWFEGPDPRGIDVALLYNPKYFTVLASKSITVNLNQTGGKELTRDVLYVTGLLVGDTVHVLVNHWPSRRGGESVTEGKRAIVAGMNKRISDSLFNVNANVRILIMGDLNDDPVDNSVAKVLGAKKDKESVTPKSLYNPWAEYYKRGIGTLGYNDSWNLFDQLILSNSFLEKNTDKWKFYKAEIFNRDFLIEKFGRYKGYPHRSFSGNTWINGYSDHLPVFVYLIKEPS